MQISETNESIVHFSSFLNDELKQVLFPKELIQLIAYLHKKYNPRRNRLLDARKARQKKYDQGHNPDFLPRDTEAILGDWKISPLPKELLKRRVEITGPVNNTKMVINMLNRTDNGVRADMAMLDFEDSMKPSFKNILDGYQNVIGAARGNLRYETPEKIYELNADDMAYIMVRCRGLHLDETNITIQGEPVSAAIADLATCFYHTAPIFVSRKLTPKYYIPKCEHHLEARWWNDIFVELEAAMKMELGTLRATFLIETLPAAFQVEEILFEIRDHAAALNVGRWDKIFSDIKILRYHPNRILGDRSSITMEKPWMENYAKRVIKICHDRGALAIGGMAAFTPGRDAIHRNEQAKKVTADKNREFNWGHDGCWVSHPYFIDIAMREFKKENQLEEKLSYFNKYSDLLPRGEGPYTMEGLRTNVRVGIVYLQSWIQDIGCVALDYLMEDLATLEISRAQVWQWVHYQQQLDDGTFVTPDLVKSIFHEEHRKILSQWEQDELPPDQLIFLETAAKEAEKIFLEKELRDFLINSSRRE